MNQCTVCPWGMMMSEGPESFQAANLYPSVLSTTPDVGKRATFVCLFHVNVVLFAAQTPSFSQSKRSFRSQNASSAIRQHAH